MAPQCRFWTQCLYRYGPQWVGLVDAGGRWVSARFRKWLRQAPEPWLAMLWLDDLHHPYVGRPRFLRRVSDRRLPLWRRTQLSRRMRRMLTLSAVGTEEGFLDLAALYDASLAYADWVVGRVIDALRTHSSWARTAVVVTADHGDMLGERRLLGHGRTADMYQALLRVPLIARLPGLGAGSSSQALVQLADVTRTLAELGGVADGLAPTAAPAVDLRDAAAGRGRPFALSEREPMGERSVAQARKKSPEFDFTPHQCHMVAVVQEGWRLIHRGDGRDSLFHAAADPDERDDLLVAEPARAAQLREVVDRWKAEVIPHPAVAGLQLQDSAILDQRLQDLGYF
jgi:arylsulfatase A-like enzyme